MHRENIYMLGLCSEMILQLLAISPLPVHHEYCRFQPVLLVDQITDIGN